VARRSPVGGEANATAKQAGRCSQQIVFEADQAHDAKSDSQATVKQNGMMHCSNWRLAAHNANQSARGNALYREAKTTKTWQNSNAQLAKR
jgi:hypothetical protein